MIRVTKMQTSIQTIYYPISIHQFQTAVNNKSSIDDKPHYVNNPRAIFHIVPSYQEFGYFIPVIACYIFFTRCIASAFKVNHAAKKYWQYLLLQPQNMHRDAC